MDEFQKDFDKLTEKVEKIKDLIFKNYIYKVETYNNYKIQNQQKLLIIKQKVEIFNNNLTRCKNKYSKFLFFFSIYIF